MPASIGRGAAHHWRFRLLPLVSDILTNCVKKDRAFIDVFCDYSAVGSKKIFHFRFRTVKKKATIT